MNPDHVTSYPLSRAQQRLWILQQLTPCTYLYHIPVLLALSADVDLQVLEQAWADVVQNEPVLRSGLSQSEPELQWSIASFGQNVMETIVLDDELPAVIDMTCDDRLAAFFLKPLAIESPPLFRCGFLKAAQQRFFMLVIHHILVDGWSVHLLVERLNQAYQARLSNAPLPSNDKAGYIEYALQEKAVAPSHTKQRDYWIQRLHQKQLVMDLITDNPRRSSLSGQGNTLHITLANDTFMHLKQLAREAECTLMQVILFGFAVMLNRFSGQDDVVVGIPVAGRSHQQWYQTIGLFVNTCLHALGLSQDASIFWHLQQVKQQVLTDMAHATIPFDEVVKALYARQQINQSAQFNVLYNFIQGEPGRKPIGYGTSPYCVLPISKFDLSLHVYAYPSQVDLFFEYSSDLYQKETINNMAEYALLLLKTMHSVKNLSLREWIWQLTPIKLDFIES